MTDKHDPAHEPSSPSADEPTPQDQALTAPSNATEAAATDEATEAPPGKSGADDNAPSVSEQKEARRQRRMFRLRERFSRKKDGAPRRRYRPKPPTDFRKEMTTIPNILTYIRMLMLPLILLVLDRDNRWSSFLAGCFFSFACFTDFFDGYFARKFNQVTVLGKLLDPLADKLIVSATLIVMIPMGRVPSWLVIVLIAREFAITGLRGIASSEGMVIAAAPLGKYKTAFQMVALFCLLIHYPYPMNYFGLFTWEVNYHRVGLVLLYVSLFFSIASAMDYFWKFAVAVDRSYKDQST